MDSYLHSWLVVESLLDDISEDRSWFWSIFKEDPAAAAARLGTDTITLLDWFDYLGEAADKWF